MPSSLPREEFCWERIEIIGSGTVTPTVDQAFRGVKKNSLLFLEFKEKEEECLGTKAIPGARTPSYPRASDYVLRVLHSASTFLGPIINLNQYIWVFDDSIWCRSSTV